MHAAKGYHIFESQALSSASSAADTERQLPVCTVG